jgi:hypothetical protein
LKIEQRMDVIDKRVLVVGLGKSGVASALFLKARGARVTVSDAKPQDQLKDEIPVLLDQGIAVETGGHGERTFGGQDLIVVSPGVATDAPPLVQARALGENVIGEIELAAQFFPGRIVAITGSNGKTTTTTLAGEIVPRFHWSREQRLTQSPCGKSRASSLKPFRRFVRESPSFSMSRPTISTDIVPSQRTRTQRRVSSKISKRKILRCSTPMI